MALLSLAKGIRDDDCALWWCGAFCNLTDDAEAPLLFSELATPGLVAMIAEIGATVVQSDASAMYWCALMGNVARLVYVAAARGETGAQGLCLPRPISCRVVVALQKTASVVSSVPSAHVWCVAAARLLDLLALSDVPSEADDNGPVPSTTTTSSTGSRALSFASLSALLSNALHKIAQSAVLNAPAWYRWNLVAARWLDATPHGLIWQAPPSNISSSTMTRSAQTNGRTTARAQTPQWRPSRTASRLFESVTEFEPTSRATTCLQVGARCEATAVFLLTMTTQDHVAHWITHAEDSRVAHRLRSLVAEYEHMAVVLSEAPDRDAFLQDASAWWCTGCRLLTDVLCHGRLGIQERRTVLTQSEIVDALNHLARATCSLAKPPRHACIISRDALMAFCRCAATLAEVLAQVVGGIEQEPPTMDDTLQHGGDAQAALSTVRSTLRRLAVDTALVVCDPNDVDATSDASDTTVAAEGGGALLAHRRRPFSRHVMNEDLWRWWSSAIRGFISTSSTADVDSSSPPSNATTRDVLTAADSATAAAVRCILRALRIVQPQAMLSHDYDGAIAAWNDLVRQTQTLASTARREEETCQ